MKAELFTLVVLMQQPVTFRTIHPVGTNCSLKEISGGRGGAVRSTSAVCSDSYFSSNFASLGGSLVSSVANLVNCSFVKNGASGGGGAVLSDNLVVESCSFSMNNGSACRGEGDF